MWRLPWQWVGLWLFLPCNVVWAQTPGVSVIGASAVSAQRVGVVAAVSGSVQIEHPGVVGHVANSGQPVFLGDVVQTGAEGRLQILLLDETVFTIGPSRW